MNDATLRGKAAIIGIGQSPVGRCQGESAVAGGRRRAQGDSGRGAEEIRN